jgi:hypothetical protein
LGLCNMAASDRKHPGSLLFWQINHSQRLCPMVETWNLRS